MHALAISISFLRHVMSLIHLLRCFQEVDELLHFVIVLVNSFSKNGPHFVTCLLGIFSSKSEST